MWTQIKHFWRFAKITSHYWDKILVSFIVSNLIELGILVPPLVLRVLFDYIYPYRDLSLLIIFSLIPLFLTFFLNILNILKSLTDLYVSQNVFKRLYAKFYSKIQRLPMRFFHEHKTGDLMYRITGDIQVIEDTILNTIPTFFSALIKLAVLIIICFSMNTSLTILAVIGVPLYFWQTHYFSKKLQSVNQENQEMNSRLFDVLEERLSNIKLIKLFHTWTSEVDQLLKQVSRLFLIERKEKLTTSTYSMISTTINRAWAVLLGVYTGYCIIAGTLTLGEVVAITSYIAMLQGPFDTLSNLYSQFIISSVSFQRIADILDHPVEYHEVAEGDKKHLDGEIEFKDVSFGYEPNRVILNHISFHIPKGSSLGIVGKSGIGKSSIVDLLLRFYTPESGQILMDGIENQKVNISSLRQQIGLVSQDATLFYGTVYENIAFGLDYDVPEKQIIEAAKKADAHDFISQLPDGYHTNVGSKGANLSSGQRQKIAIARALLKKPKIIIFDEATAALDGESEKQIQRTIQKLKGKTTVILIAHRLSSLKNVDRIIVIDNHGTIAEEGHLVELMENKGLFYRLYEHQMGGFQQYLQQLQFLIKSLRRYDRPVSIAALDIVDFEKLSYEIDETQMDKFIDDLGTAISLFLREVDFACYQGNGRYWISLPETLEDGAKRACERLETHLKEVQFKSIPGHSIHVKWAAVQCQRDDEVESVIDRINDEMGTPHLSFGE